MGLWPPGGYGLDGVGKRGAGRCRRGVLESFGVGYGDSPLLTQDEKKPGRLVPMRRPGGQDADHLGQVVSAVALRG